MAAPRSLRREGSPQEHYNVYACSPYMPNVMSHANETQSPERGLSPLPRLPTGGCIPEHEDKKRFVPFEELRREREAIEAMRDAGPPSPRPKPWSHAPPRPGPEEEDLSESGESGEEDEGPPPKKSRLDERNAKEKKKRVKTPEQNQRQQQRNAAVRAWRTEARDLNNELVRLMPEEDQKELWKQFQHLDHAAKRALRVWEMGTKTGEPYDPNDVNAFALIDLIGGPERTRKYLRLPPYGPEGGSFDPSRPGTTPRVSSLLIAQNQNRIPSEESAAASEACIRIIRKSNRDSAYMKAEKARLAEEAKAAKAAAKPGPKSTTLQAPGHRDPRDPPGNPPRGPPKSYKL